MATREMDVFDLTDEQLEDISGGIFGWFSSGDGSGGGASGGGGGGASSGGGGAR